MKLQTLVFILRDDKVLLGMKNRGFGEGKWNGYGGKLDGMESLRACAKRELHEESNLVVDENDLVHLGHVEFVNGARPDRRVHVYICDSFDGVLRATEEMTPCWFDVKDIPYGTMWEDAYFWMPFVLKRTPFEATFVLDEDKSVRDVHIRVKKD